jgi:hypothetical protein
MPRDGAFILSDVRGLTLSIVCEPCGGLETYSVARLMERHGDAKLTDLLQTLQLPERAPGRHPRPLQSRLRKAFLGSLSDVCPDGVAIRWSRAIASAPASDAVLASRCLVASHPCPKKGDQGNANDPCGDDDPSDRVEAEYGCSSFRARLAPC